MVKGLGNAWFGRDWCYDEEIWFGAHAEKQSVCMQEGEGNVRPHGPNFMSLPCLHRDIVTSCSFLFGCLGAVLYQPSAAGWIWLGGAMQAGQSCLAPT